MATLSEIHAHLKAGHEVVLPSYTRAMVFDARHINYIRQDKDGKGFRLGWPGKKSVYAFPDMLKLVPPGLTVKR